MRDFLRNVIRDNGDLSKYPEFYFYILSRIESIIPKNCRKSFYQNLNDVKIDFKSNSKKDLRGKYNFGIYDASINKITMYPCTIYKSCKKGKLSKEMFETLFVHSLCHELLHMSSTFKKDGNIFSGPDIYPTSVSLNKNRGLTEGITDFIVYMDSQLNPIDNSCYFIELRFVQMLSMIVETVDILSVYFGNMPVSYLSNKFLEFGIPTHVGNNLFELIENSYNFRKEEEEQPFTTFAQNLLTKIFMSKINYLLSNGFAKEEIIYLVKSFKDLIITTETLVQSKKFPRNFPGINESYKMILNFEQHLNTKYSL